MEGRSQDPLNSRLQVPAKILPLTLCYVGAEGEEMGGKRLGFDCSIQ